MRFLTSEVFLLRVCLDFTLLRNGVERFSSGPPRLLSALEGWTLEVLDCDLKGNRAFLRVLSTEGRGVRLWEHSTRPKGFVAGLVGELMLVGGPDHIYYAMTTFTVSNPLSGLGRLGLRNSAHVRLSGPDSGLDLSHFQHESLWNHLSCSLFARKQ